MDEIRIRRMELTDLDEVVDLENHTFAMPWSRESFEQELTRNVAARYLVADLNGHVIGYAGAWIILDESHITNIAIAEAYRGNGYGKILTSSLMQYLSNLGAAYATLEVRVSNERAQNLYKGLGFVAIGKRKKYYEDNGEDAYLMVCDHMPPAEEGFEEKETIRE